MYICRFGHREAGRECDEEINGKRRTFVLVVFGTGVAVGKIVEKIERLDRKREDEEHISTSKNNRQ